MSTADVYKSLISSFSIMDLFLNLPCGVPFSYLFLGTLLLKNVPSLNFPLECPYFTYFHGGASSNFLPKSVFFLNSSVKCSFLYTYFYLFPPLSRDAFSLNFPCRVPFFLLVFRKISKVWTFPTSLFQGRSPAELFPQSALFLLISILCIPILNPPAECPFLTYF